MPTDEQIIYDAIDTLQEGGQTIIVSSSFMMYTFPQIERLLANVPAEKKFREAIKELLYWANTH